MKSVDADQIKSSDNDNYMKVVFQGNHKICEKNGALKCNDQQTSIILPWQNFRIPAPLRIYFLELIHHSSIQVVVAVLKNFMVQFSCNIQRRLKKYAWQQIAKSVTLFTIHFTVGKWQYIKFDKKYRTFSVIQYIWTKVLPDYGK
jgi:hypothetical protein